MKASLPCVPSCTFVPFVVQAFFGAAYSFKALNISRAAFAPDPPVNPAPGCVPLPHRYKFSIGVLYRAQSSSGRMVKN